MQHINVQHRIEIEAPKSRVWEALTQPDQIIQWFAPALMGATMQVDAQGKLTVHFGEMGADFALLKVTEPQRQVSITGLPDRFLTIVFTLEDQGDSTHVTVSQAGADQVPAPAYADRDGLSSAAWEKTLANLKAHVEGAALPHPQALTSPLLGYWREIDGRLAPERSIWIDAPREQVWNAVTDPGQIQQWFSPNTPWQRSALDVGGRLYVRNDETGADMYVEVIQQMDAPKQIVTECIPEAPDTVVKHRTYTLQEENGGTRLIMRLAGYEAEPEDTRWSHMEQDSTGFGMMLQNTKAHLEGQPLPFPWGF